MRQIRRAAVTGLFAIWLAPLSANAETPRAPGCCTDRGVRAESAMAERSRGEGEESGEETARRTG